MMRRPLALLALALMGQASPPPLVPEGIHQEIDGPPRLCGFTGSNLADLERRIVNDPSFREEGSTNQYRVFNREQDFVQFVFPRPATLGFPMATCRKLLPARDGTTIKRELHCDGTREQCDRIFLEFDALDSQISEPGKGE